jgi:hypothetical protein
MRHGSRLSNEEVHLWLRRRNAPAQSERAAGPPSDERGSSRYLFGGTTKSGEDTIAIHERLT